MKLTRTNVSYHGKRVWLEDADEGQIAQLEYRCGEIGAPAHLKLESTHGERRTEEIGRH